VLQLGEQSLVELDKQVGEPVDILVNGKIFARGEVVTVSENFGVRITELLAGVSEL
jgi:flagellar motor switch protein FliN/FliY